MDGAAQRSDYATGQRPTGFQGLGRCETVLHYWIEWRRVSARPRETGIQEVRKLAASQFFKIHPANPPPSRFDAGELPAPEQATDRGFGKPGESNGLFDGEKQLVPQRHVRTR